MRGLCGVAVPGKGGGMDRLLGPAFPDQALDVLGGGFVMPLCEERRKSCRKEAVMRRVPSRLRLAALRLAGLEPSSRLTGLRDETECCDI